MKLEVTPATSTQTAVPELGKEEKTLYYLIIGEGAQKVIINVGEKTYKGVQELNNQKYDELKKLETETKNIKPTK